MRREVRNRLLIPLICALIAARTGATQSPADRPDQEASGNWNLMLHRDHPRGFIRNPEAVFDYLEQAGGLYTQIASTTVGQSASASRTGRDSLLNTSYSFGGGWELLKNATISWWVRGGRPIGAPLDADLSGDIGSILDVNASLENDPVYLRELYWVQRIGDSFGLTVGYADSSYRYDFNVMANDDADNFLNDSLVNTPAIPFPDSSIAADLLWRVSPSFKIQAGIYQTNCRNYTEDCPKKLNENDWMVPAEFIYSTDLTGLGPGTYRLLLFTTSTGEQRGSGVSISVDQQIGRFTPFARLSISDPDITDIERFISIGVGYDAPLGRQWDTLGMALATGQPSDKARRRESVLEIFWRIRFNPFVALTPDLQIIFDPADNPAERRVTVLGLRLQLDF